MRPALLAIALLLTLMPLAVSAQNPQRGGVGEACTNTPDCVSGLTCDYGPDGYKICQAPSTGGVQGSPFGGNPSNPPFGGNPSQSPTVTGGGGQNITLVNPLGTTDLKTLITRILEFVVRIGSVVVIFMLVYVGFLFVKARGNPEEINDAKHALLYTVIGALILLGAQAIALGIQATVQALSVGG